mmetsp:Transcript_14603/g.34637  ORF Transcript_14603/g.34637 Transcript_14603/m.34637 type:complete len:282 (-) Transcript_14603:430-1275(-)
MGCCRQHLAQQRGCLSHGGILREIGLPSKLLFQPSHGPPSLAGVYRRLLPTGGITWPTEQGRNVASGGLRGSHNSFPRFRLRCPCRSGQSCWVDWTDGPGRAGRAQDLGSRRFPRLGPGISRGEHHLHGGCGACLQADVAEESITLLQLAAHKEEPRLHSLTCVKHAESKAFQVQHGRGCGELLHNLSARVAVDSALQTDFQRLRRRCISFLAGSCGDDGGFCRLGHEHDLQAGVVRQPQMLQRLAWVLQLLATKEDAQRVTCRCWHEGLVHHRLELLDSG